MTRRTLLISLVVLGFLGPSPAQEKKDTKEEEKKKVETIKKERQRFQGTWQVVEYVTGGEPLPEDQVKAMQAVFAGDRMTISMPKGESKREYTVTLDPSKKPAELEATPEIAKIKAKIRPGMPGIYEFEGDTLKLCLARLGGKIRPKEFESTAAAGTILIKLRKAK